MERMNVGVNEVSHESSYAPIARAPSTSCLYSCKSSATSDILRSSGEHCMNRVLGGGNLLRAGDCGREEAGVSNLLGTGGGGSKDERRDGGGELWKGVNDWS
jgi:hypothetical protein